MVKRQILLAVGAPKLPKMRGLGFQKNLRTPWKFIIPSLISCICVIISQFTLSMVPRYFPSFPLLVMLSYSVLLLLVIAALSRICRRLLRIYASAPAFVFFNIFFIWAVHISVIRKAVSLFTDIVVNAECALLLVGFHRLVSYTYALPLSAEKFSDINFLIQNSFRTRRLRYCKCCKAYVRGFDHHCPAFGNCIGQNNHLLFMVLLVGFVMVEASYIVCSNQFITKSKIVDEPMLETTLSGNLAISTMLFALLQVLWQVIFLIWHIYCVCVNIRTDEWINWKKYPEFQLVQPQAGQSFPETMFINPYDKGVLGNIKEFLSLRK
ncbi:zinc finger protein [Macleaya cordata]|uniref:S-acyltransferase n=1 Tax=Macleaya cordata TaxID=56857 RepID=A0A200R6I1_MACCD|nr:zinc finger protein [Macleaya cordata]